MDKLEHIFALQAAFDEELTRQRQLEDVTPEIWIQREILAIVAELGELLAEVNFKWWKNPQPVNRDAVKEELVDILHFFVSMCLKAGFDAGEIYQGYLEKNRENFRRQAGLSDKKGYAIKELAAD
ncbi:MAG: dUTPase [Firmicutes bacterium]|nr:dUTPase [Bacillota bacterium]